MFSRIMVSFFSLGLGLVALAADIQINSSKTGYTVEISGSIKQGDYETLSGIFKGERAFPTSTRITSAGGDLSEAMRLGELYRQAHLSAIAVDPCDSACFLWLTGAASRTITTDVTATILAPQSTAEVQAYMLSMDVPADHARSLAEAAATSGIAMKREVFEVEIGERPTSFNDWLLQGCGAPTEQERIDHRKIQSASFLKVLKKMQAADPGRKDINQVIAKYERMESEVSHFPDDYKASLLNKWLEIQQCQRDLVLADRRRLMATLTEQRIQLSSPMPAPQ
jgi:hypothetical protein